MRVVLGIFWSVASVWCQSRAMERVDEALESVFSRGKKVAVLVGVGKYPEFSNLSSLQFPGKDVDDLRRHLELTLGYKVLQLKDEQATRGAVRNVLGLATRMLTETEGSTLLFFFSGHGWKPKATATGNYLATYDATAEELDGSGLAVEEVLRTLAQSKAQRRMVFLDACRNAPGDPQEKTTQAGRTMGALEKAKGTRILFSTQQNQVSWEDAQLQNGVFTHFLLRGLKGEAVGPDGMLTFGDLAAYVRDRVESHALKMNHLQVPTESSWELEGDFLLARMTRPEPITSVWCSAGWNEVKDVVDPSILQEFVKKFGECSEQLRLVQMRLLRLSAVPLKSPAPTLERPAAHQNIAPSSTPGAEDTWRVVKDSGNVLALIDFIRRFPDTPNAKLAELKIRELSPAIESRAEPRRTAQKPQTPSRFELYRETMSEAHPGRLIVGNGEIAWEAGPVSWDRESFGKKTTKIVPKENFSVSCGLLKTVKKAGISLRANSWGGSSLVLDLREQRMDLRALDDDTRDRTIEAIKLACASR